MDTHEYQIWLVPSSTASQRRYTIESVKESGGTHVSTFPGNKGVTANHERVELNAQLEREGDTEHRYVLVRAPLGDATRQIEIAREFIRAHNRADMDDWNLGAPLTFDNEADLLLHIYQALMQGTYGNVEQDGNTYNVEISAHDSKSGNPIIFSWEL